MDGYALRYLFPDDDRAVADVHTAPHADVEQIIFTIFGVDDPLAKLGECFCYSHGFPGSDANSKSFSLAGRVSFGVSHTDRIIVAHTNANAICRKVEDIFFFYVFNRLTVDGADIYGLWVNVTDALRLVHVDRDKKSNVVLDDVAVSQLLLHLNRYDFAVCK
jgi:hypothetical protein